MKLFTNFNQTFLLIALTSWTLIAQPLAEGQLKFLGNALDITIHSNYTDYWNQLTPGNAGKWGWAEGARDQYNWAPLDNLYNFAQQKNLLYKHHTLIWDNQQPGWINDLDSADQRAEIEEWIQLVGERYPGMDQVDVVNEPLNAPPSYAQALGGDGETGWDWIITSFELARQYCAPGVELILNEYNVLHDNARTTSYLEIINLLKERDLIDGIGIQGHYFEFKGQGYTYSITAIKNNLDRLADTGLPVYITEFDIDEPNDQVQLENYKTYFPIFWDHPAVKGMTLWGYVEGDIWQPDGYLVQTREERYAERPAMEWLREYILNPPPPKGHYVADWGILGGRTGGWDFVPGDLSGNAGIAGEDYLDGSWAAVRGQFNTPFKISNEYAILLEGKLKFNGAGPYTWSGLRYGLFYHDSIGILKNADTDSAYWSGDEEHASGYLFIPPSGTNNPVEWPNGGTGNIGVINDGNAIFASDTGLAIAELQQGPGQAILTAGTYEWAISVQQVAENSNEIRFYLVHEENSYWFGSIDTIVVDTALSFNFFNGVVFALNGSDGADTSAIRGMDILDVYVKGGDPIEVPCCYTSIEQQDLIQPEKYALQQNFPNPFNPGTTISYQLPMTTDIEISVFNLLGQKVVTLFKGQQQAGNHSIFFDGKDLVSGVYFYSLEAGDFIETKKLILLK